LCYNCKGEHTATSPNCPKFKEYQQKIQKTIDQYSSSIKQIKPIPTCPNLNNLEDFPALRSIDKNEQITIIETLTEKILLVVEQATQKIFDTLNQKFESLVNQLVKKLNIEIEKPPIETGINKQKTNHNLKATTTQQITVQEQSIEEIQDEDADPTLTPINGIKRKYISSNSPLDKLANTTNNSRI
jgi:hypothetical protein